MRVKTYNSASELGLSDALGEVPGGATPTTGWRFPVYEGGAGFVAGGFIPDLGLNFVIGEALLADPRWRFGWQDTVNPELEYVFAFVTDGNELWLTSDGDVMEIV
jgi:hypothetical protein